MLFALRQYLWNLSINFGFCTQSSPHFSPGVVLGPALLGQNRWLRRYRNQSFTWCTAVASIVRSAFSFLFWLCFEFGNKRQRFYFPFGSWRLPLRTLETDFSILYYPEEPSPPAASASTVLSSSSSWAVGPHEQGILYLTVSFRRRYWEILLLSDHTASFATIFDQKLWVQVADSPHLFSRHRDSLSYHHNDSSFWPFNQGSYLTFLRIFHHLLSIALMEIDCWLGFGFDRSSGFCLF